MCASLEETPLKEEGRDFVMFFDVCLTRFFLALTGLRASASSTFSGKSVTSAFLKQSHQISAGFGFSPTISPSLRLPTWKRQSVSDVKQKVRIRLCAMSTSISVHSGLRATGWPATDPRRDASSASADICPVGESARRWSWRMAPPSSSVPPKQKSWSSMPHMMWLKRAHGARPSVIISVQFPVERLSANRSSRMKLFLPPWT
mmetsp:Transcript_1066/g.3943  ORF Transcript_1066/g.3943 Transcript_1066/m.3943 type:complete len:203 (+) Transcript_1066:285-893(+)